MGNKWQILATFVTYNNFYNAELNIKEDIDVIGTIRPSIVRLFSNILIKQRFDTRWWWYSPCFLFFCIKFHGFVDLVLKYSHFCPTLVFMRSIFYLDSCRKCTFFASESWHFKLAFFPARFHFSLFHSSKMSSNFANFLFFIQQWKLISRKLYSFAFSTFYFAASHRQFLLL